MSKQKVTIYTDGSCEPNPGPGGWGALLQYGSVSKALQGFQPDTTNNRMELTAALKALNALKKACVVTLYTDSEYLRKGITEWLPNWQARNWRRKGGKLANVDLWKALDKAMQRHEIDWKWVKAHAGDQKNEQVDRLARKAMKDGIKGMKL